MTNCGWQPSRGICWSCAGRMSCWYPASLAGGVVLCTWGLFRGLSTTGGPPPGPPSGFSIVATLRNRIYSFLLFLRSGGGRGAVLPFFCLCRLTATLRLSGGLVPGIQPLSLGCLLPGGTISDIPPSLTGFTGLVSSRSCLRNVSVFGILLRPVSSLFVPGVLDEYRGGLFIFDGDLAAQLCGAAQVSIYFLSSHAPSQPSGRIRSPR